MKQMRRALFLAMALVAATAPAAPRGFLDERLAFIGPRDNCMNLLINIAPRADGKLPDEAMKILAELAVGEK